MGVGVFANTSCSTRFRLWIIVVACVVGAGVCGAALGLWLRGNRESGNATSRRLATSSLLTYMGTIKVGGGIPDASLVNALGQKVQLSSLVVHRTTILFVDPECGTCLSAISELCGLLSHSRRGRKVVIMTKSIHPFEEWIDCEHIHGENLLKDVDGNYHTMMNIVAVPFTLFVDEKLTVQNAISGHVSAKEIENYLDDGSVGY